ncbi:MAG: hypothetical protein KQH63_00950 [Desulfobulbaceae bacterium]|nr:hypothetical protein [Desulfobulbaceae bacterium]
MKNRKLRKALPFFVSAIACALAISLTQSSVLGKVSGECSNCHTMHNSQDGTPVVRKGTGAAWSSDDGQITGGSVQDSPTGRLLVTDCIGCHSSATEDTIITLGDNKIPIVFNTNGYPSEALAAGNFYQVAQGAQYDGYGHNVYGISAIDSKLLQAPGGGNQCGGYNSSCHYTLAAPPNGENWYRGGCQGCHYNVFHHEDNNNYRFLNSHKGDMAYVEGVEDEFWEQPSHGGHNSYKGVIRDSDQHTLMSTQSISSYCGGCHRYFHQNDSITDGSVWLRHPTDIALPTDGEYAVYDPATNYNMEAPVAWVNPETPVREEAVVMCLSCHRVHGSEHPDILRWDYDNMIAGNGGDYADTGCFVCHTSKD